MDTTPTAEPGHFHAVRFYKDATSLAEIVCAFLAEGLTRGEPAIVIATEAHTGVFLECFAAKGVDVDVALRDGSLTVLDAEETLNEFMRDGIPVAHAFTDTLAPVLRATAARFPGVTIRAYGEMVDILWKREQATAAIRLEMLWNDLAQSHRFGLLCGYSMGNFYKGSATEDICQQHSHVLTESGTQIPVN